MAQYYFDFYYLPPQKEKSVLMYVKYLSQIGFSGAMTIAVRQMNLFLLSMKSADTSKNCLTQIQHDFLEVEFSNYYLRKMFISTTKIISFFTRNKWKLILRYDHVSKKTSFILWLKSSFLKNQIKSRSEVRSFLASASTLDFLGFGVRTFNLKIFLFQKENICT